MMKFTTGTIDTGRLELEELQSGAYFGKEVTVHGAVYANRPMGQGLTFLTLRKREGVLQCVCDSSVEVSDIPEESAVIVTGLLQKEERAPGGIELHASGVEVLSRPAEPMPVPVNKWKLSLNLDTELGLRPVVLRHLKKRSVFRIQAALGRAFREYL